jgi:hypothetical protein
MRWTRLKTTFTPSILITNFQSPVDYHFLESTIRIATRSTKEQLVTILHSPAIANQEGIRANWSEIQKPLTWTHVESTALAQDMDKVLLDTVVLLRPQYKPVVEGSTEDERLVKGADSLYVFEDGAS